MILTNIGPVSILEKSGLIVGLTISVKPDDPSDLTLEAAKQLEAYFDRS